MMITNLFMLQELFYFPQMEIGEYRFFHKDWNERANDKVTIFRKLVLVDNAYLSFSSPVPSLT